MTATTNTGQASEQKVEAYVRRCVRYFDDLPIEEQASLEHDVREIVTEVTSELDGDPADLVGPPHRFASELRSAAGLPPRFADATTAVQTEARPSAIASFACWLKNIAAPWCAQLATELRPAWWVARGIMPAVFLYAVSESELLSMIVALAAVVASVEIGRTQRAPGLVRRVLAGLVGLMAVVLFFGSAVGSSEASYVEEAYYYDGDEGAYASAAFEGAIPPIPVYLHVSDAHTGEVWWETSSPSHVELLATLPSTNDSGIAADGRGFVFEYSGPLGSASGHVSSWDLSLIHI